MSKIITFLIALHSITYVYSNSGSIKGQIIDAETGETLIGASIIITNTTTGTISDFDGNYSIDDLEPGLYNLSISYVSYTTLQFNKIEVKANETSILNAEMSIARTEIEAIKVVSKANRESENLLLLEQKEAIVASQSIGAKELSRKGVSNAEGAVSKISGVSKQEDAKNVFVRGLGDRYNSTTLNGFALPSEDPEYKNISLDFFTSDMIQAVGVSKVFSSKMTGDAAGALIDIKSKELNNKSDLEISYSMGLNTQTTGKPFYKTDGVNSFGYVNQECSPKPNSSTGKMDQYSFQNSLDPSHKNSPLNQNITLSGGKKFGNNKHSFFLVGSYETEYFNKEGVSRKSSTDGTVFQDYKYNKYEQNTSHLLMGNLNLNFNNNYISYNLLYIHTNNQYFSEYYGKESEIFQNVEELGSKGLLRRQQINDNSILVNQILWKWDINTRWDFDLGGAVNSVSGAEPDRRSNYLSDIGNNQLELRSGDARQQRFYNTIKENDLNLNGQLSYLLSNNSENKSAISLGYNGRFVNKEFNAPIYNEDWMISQTSLPVHPINEVQLDEDFNQVNLDNGFFTLELYEDLYSVTKYLNSGYLNLIYELSKKLTANVGLRADQVYVKIKYDVNKGQDIGNNKIDQIYFLPSLNLKYVINSKNTIRIGGSQSYTLPQDKEISPFTYIGVDFSSAGNPDLIPSTNYNLDLKWDNYLSSSEIISLNGFYKYIADPIARVDKGNSAGLLTYDNITDKANVLGVEFEFRKNLINRSAGEISHKIDFGLNASYIYSNVELDSKVFAQNTSSTLEGAAPYIANADITYSLETEKLKWVSAFVVNYISDRVHTIGTHGFNDIIENSLTTFDFISTATIAKHWEMNFKAKNLLNPYISHTRKPNNNSDAVVLSQYKKGVFISLGLSYIF